jgi:hypothetical protein
MYFILGLMILFSSCLSKTDESFQYEALINGVKVICSEQWTGYCGAHLTDCSDGASYSCVKDVKRVRLSP